MSTARKIPAAALTLLLTLSFSHGHGSSLTAGRRSTRLDASAPEQQAPPVAVKIRKLKPSAFRALPAGIVTELNRRACSIPQVSIEGYETGKPHNVVSGEFARKGQKDWAALCSRGGQTAIHIFWGRPTKCASIIGAAEDEAGRYLGVADAKYIRVHYEAYGGPELPPLLDHLGLNDGFAETASQVWYCYRGKWRVLQGAD
jgi:hypothetical protein